MAAYKQLNSQDIIISPLEVNKSFTFQSNEFTDSDVGIQKFIGKPGDFLNNKTITGDIGDLEQYEVLIYNSIKQLYYTNYISGSFGTISNVSTASFNTDGTISGDQYQTNYYNFESTTLTPYRAFPTGSDAEIGVLSIPTKLFGNYIKPHSFNLSSPLLNFPIKDDGDGVLISGEVIVGNIIYEHGIIILYITPYPEGSRYGSAIYGEDLYGSNTVNPVPLLDSEITCSFSSSQTIYETQYKCTISPNEFNYSLNPTVLSGSKGDIYSQFTGSYFEPYVTTVGIYNQNHELLIVGKLSEPLPTSRTTDTTILINIDR